MKKTVLVLGTLVAGLAAWVYLSPRLAAKHLRDAARTGDVEALNEVVDFPLVRENLKADLKASLLESTSARQQEHLRHGARRWPGRPDGRRAREPVRLTQRNRRACALWFNRLDTRTARAATHNDDAIPRCKYLCSHGPQYRAPT